LPPKADCTTRPRPAARRRTDEGPVGVIDCVAGIWAPGVFCETAQPENDATTTAAITGLKVWTTLECLVA
jgi:hypothetical protein